MHAVHLQLLHVVKGMRQRGQIININKTVVCHGIMSYLTIVQCYSLLWKYLVESHEKSTSNLDTVLSQFT